MESMELTAQPGDLTYACKCKVIREQMPHSEFVGFLRDDGFDVPVNDQRVLRYLREHRDIEHYRLGHQPIASYPVFCDVPEARKAIVGLFCDRIYAHLKVFSVMPAGHFTLHATNFLLYTACSEHSHVERIALEALSQENRELAEGTMQRLGMEVSRALCIPNETYFFKRGALVGKVVRRHVQRLTIDIRSIDEQFYAGGSPA